MKTTVLTGRLGRVIRYGLIGTGVSILYTLLATLFHETKTFEDPALASAMAFALVLPISFLSHRRVTYADAANDSLQWARFVLVAVTSFTIAVGSAKLASLQGWPFWTALLATWILIPAANYFINVLWVFRVSHTFGSEKPSAPQSAELEG